MSHLFYLAKHEQPGDSDDNEMADHQMAIEQAAQNGTRGPEGQMQSNGVRTGSDQIAVSQADRLVSVNNQDKNTFVRHTIFHFMMHILNLKFKFLIIHNIV